MEVVASSDQYRSSSSSASSPAPARYYLPKPGALHRHISFEDSPDWDDIHSHPDDGIHLARRSYYVDDPFQMSQGNDRCDLEISASRLVIHRSTGLLYQQVVNECSEAENWLRERKQQQDALPKHANPVLLVSDLKKKAETLDRFCKPIMTKPKPAPKPQTSPPQTPPPQPETQTPEPQTPEQPQSGSGATGEPGSEGGVQQTPGEQMDMDKPDDSAGAAA